jgi:hypothetical protein
MIPTGNVSIVVNGKAMSAPIGPGGAFSAVFPTASLTPGSYSVLYSYAGDPNFNAVDRTGGLTVVYGTRLLFDNTRPVKGAVLPIKLELTDVNGTDLSSAGTTVQAVSLQASDGTTQTLSSRGNANTNGYFRYDAALGGYIFNLDTSRLAADTYTLFYNVGNDPTLYSLTFVVR